MSQHGYTEPERLSSTSKAYQEENMSQTIELLVETLTGTAFEMTVSPDDTVFAIKSKIFRVEGIPVAQQHLLYNLKELEDSSCLSDYSIKDGSTLKLVLSMKGGPITTRRLPMPSIDDIHWREIKDFVESSRDESMEWLPNGCKMTVLVFRDGDNVNLIRVIKNEDGSFTPVSDSAHSSSRSLADESCEDGVVQENAVTMGKMMELRRRMETLSIQQRKSLNTCRVKESKEKVIQKTRSEEILSSAEKHDTLASTAFTYNPMYTDGSDLSIVDNDSYDYDCPLMDGSRCSFLPPIGGYQVNSDSSTSLTCNMSQYGDCDTPTERIKLTDALAGSILVKSPRSDESEEETRQVDDTTTETAAHGIAMQWGPTGGGEGSVLRRVVFGSSSGLAVLSQPAPPPLFSSSTSDLEALRRNRILPTLSRHRNREHLHLSDECLPRERLDTRMSSETLLEDRLQEERLLPSDRLEIGAERRRRRNLNTFESTIKRVPNDSFCDVEQEPPLVQKKKVRCSFCRKRLSIATVHRCRCGAEFCAPHRYAEVHGCAYNYKTEPANISMDGYSRHSSWKTIRSTERRGNH